MRALSPTLLDRRMLAAIRPLDPLGRPAAGRVEARADGARFLTKPDGTLILQSWSGLAGFDTAFENQPAAPAPGSSPLTVELIPISNALMPRSIELSLPRDADPSRIADADSLFRALPAVLSASTAMAKPGQTCGLLTRVVRDSNEAPVAGAVLRLIPDVDQQLATIGITNRHGEALLLIASLPLASVGAGAQLTSDHKANLQLFIDPAAIRSDGSEAEPLNPDTIIAAAPAAASASITLRSRSTTRAELRWSPP